MTSPTLPIALRIGPKKRHSRSHVPSATEYAGEKIWREKRKPIANNEIGDRFGKELII